MVNEPITNPVLIFAIAMLIFLLAPLIMAKLKIPGIIGLIFAGVIVGPNGIGLLERDPTIILLGTVGLLYIIFIAGLEINLEGFKKYRQQSLVFGSFSFFIPFIFGIILGFILDYSIAGSILLGSLLGSHTLLAYPIASRLGITKNKAVTTTVGGTIVTDTSALLILAIVAAAMTGELSPSFWITMIGLLVLYVIAVLLIIPLLAKSFFRTLGGGDGFLEFTFVMTILFVSAYLATLVGLEPIIGSFLAGLALNRYILEHSPLMNRIKFVGNALFIPFFLLSVGMLMDLSVLINEPSAWILSALIVLFVNSGKFLGAWVSGKIYKYSSDEIKLMFGLSIPQAAATLAATLVGYDLGLFDQATVNGVIVMILVTCMIGPYVVEKYSRKLALLEEQKPYEPNEAPQRILIPVANPKTMESLLDLAFILRGKDMEPIYPLSVVQEYNGRAAEKVAEAEKLLNKAVSYCSGADIPVHLLTRVDQNITSGIVRAMEESRITTVVIGWNGKLSTPQRIFGGTLDQVLDRTTEMIFVSKLDNTLNTTKKIICVLPPGIDHKTGYYEAIQSIKLIAGQLGATLVVVVIKDDMAYHKQSFARIKPDITTKYTHLSSWNELQHYLLLLKKDDLMLIMSARRGTIAWHPRLEEFPRMLSKSDVVNFIIVYPPEKEKVDLRGSRGIPIPRTLLPKSRYDD